MKRNVALVLALLVVLGAGAGISAFYLGSNATSGQRLSSMPKFASAREFIRAFKKGVGAYGGFEELGMAPSTLKSAGSDAVPRHSTTNVQVEGVDEADTVKTDGRFIYTISGQSVFILAAYPPEEARVVAGIDLLAESRPAGMFVYGDRLVVMGSRYTGDTGIREENATPLPADVTFINTYDTSKKDEPRLLRTVEYEGYCSTSRMIKDNIHIAIATYPHHVLYEKKDLAPSDIIPAFRANESGQAPGAFRPACDWRDVECVDPGGFSSFLSVVSFSLDDREDHINRRVVAGYSDNAYASAGSLYIAGTDYRYLEQGPFSSGREEASTRIYKFRLDGPRTAYLSSAEVPGTVLNQFSMDESNGYFRIATTRWHAGREGGDATNNVYILDAGLKMTGRLEGLAQGETIYSARFVGDRAYLVTFKKTDPFFVLDLSDPADPGVLGALKIPGYSDYLHPYDENHIIGIGKNTQEADPAEGNFAWYQGMKIAIFDVTDFANPKELYKVDIGDRGTDSYALYDHKAFLFDREKNLLVLPVLLAELTPEQKASQDTRAFDFGEYRDQGAYVYDVSLENGLRLKGRVTHLDDPSELSRDHYYYDSTGAVRRSLYIGDSLYTISDAAVKIHRLSDLAEEAGIRLGEQG